MYTAPQIMMTLAQLSATSPNARPSGETIAQQAARILDGIGNTLKDTSLATEGLWNAIWLALTPDGANLVFIATCPTRNAMAVCVRGTQFNSLVDLGEDLAVSEVAQFTPGDSPLLVSSGAMKAFADATAAIGMPGGNLVDQLTSILAVSPTTPQPTIFVTGHSLGGAMATMIALYLAELAAQQTWPTTPAVAAYTFAAPTAGLQTFASAYDTVMGTAPNQAYRYYNQWDAVPYAWAGLAGVVAEFYPGPSKKNPDNPGPLKTKTVDGLLIALAEQPGNNKYVQTNGNSAKGKGTTVLNTDYSVRADLNHTTTLDFLGQVAFQHNCYLELLSAPPLPAAGKQYGPPQVTGLSVNNGPVTGGGNVTISGGYFTSDSVVDFGTVPASIVSYTDSQIVVTQPAFIGTVDVRVTNYYGTSAITTSDQFAAPPPLAPTVTGVSPTAGPTVGSGDAPYTVTVTGTGFIEPSNTPYSVSFGDNPGSNVTVLSLTELTVTPPAAGSGTVDVTVTNALGTSAVNSGDEFVLGAPLVTGVQPAAGPSEATTMPTVTITGLGFTGVTEVTFGDTAGTNLSVGSPTSLTVTPPAIKLPLVDKTVDVVIENSAKQKSDVTPADQYIYYPVPKKL